MRPRILAALLIAAASTAASAADVEEQSRRCRMEKNAFMNDTGAEGAECLKLRAMLGMPEPPQVNIYVNPRGRDYDRTVTR